MILGLIGFAILVATVYNLCLFHRAVDCLEEVAFLARAMEDRHRKPQPEVDWDQVVAGEGDDHVVIKVEGE